MQIIFKIIVLLVNLLKYTVAQDESCGWLFDTVNFLSLVPAHQHYMGILQEQLMANISSSKILEYMLQITVGCNGKTSDVLMRSLILQGVSPNVHLTIENGFSLQPSILKYDIRGLLTPVNDSSKDTCNEFNCPSVWFVPFPVQNISLRAHIEISSGGIGYHNFYLATTLEVAHLFKNKSEISSKVIPFANAVKNMLKLSPLYIDVNPESEMSISISLLQTETFVLLATSDFRKYFFTEIIPNKTNFSRVCVKSSQKVISVMLFSSMHLVGTEVGLLAQNNNSFHLVSSMCVSQITTKRDEKSLVVLLVSNHSVAKDKCGSVSVAYIPSKISSWPTFIEVKDHWGSNIHQYCLLTLSFDCCLVSSALSYKASLFYFLVLNERKDVYYILGFNRAKNIWSKICNFKATVQLLRLLVHDTISEPIIFAYGSVIVICQQKDQTFIHFGNQSMDKEIIQLITLYDNYFLFVTRDKEVGMGQINSKFVFYLSHFWSRNPLNLDNLVGMYKSSSGTPTLLKSVKSPDNNEIVLKTVSLDYKNFIEQFDYNKNLRESVKPPACTIERLDFNIENMTKLTGVKSFKLNPSEFNENIVYNSKQAVFLYQGVASFIADSAINTESSESGYHSMYRDAITKWQYDQDTLVFKSLSELKEKIKQRPAFELQAKNYQQEYNKDYDSSLGFPSTVYLDRRDVFTIQVAIRNTPNHSYSSEPIKIIYSLSELQVQSYQLYKKGYVTTYEIQIKGTNNVYEKHPPRSTLVSSLIEFQFLDDNGQSCVQNSIEPKGKYKVEALLGCPPSKHLVFDWFRSVKRNNYHFQDNYDCLHPQHNKPCFGFNGAFSPVFTIEDDIAGTEEIYKDPLIFLVIGGGAVDEGIRHFTKKEIEDFNFVNGSEHHAIWRPQHHHDEPDEFYDDDSSHSNLIKKSYAKFGSKFARKIIETVPTIEFGGDPIHWMCEWHSPCGDVYPKFPDDAQYDLLIEVTNRGLHTNFTDCDLTLHFKMRLHGLPASLIHKTLPQLAIAVAFISLLFIFYHCFRIYRKKLNNELNDVNK